jgi:hypothetical protein
LQGRTSCRRFYTKPAMGRHIYAIDARFLFAAFDSLGLRSPGRWNGTMPGTTHPEVIRIKPDAPHVS